jgi:hypothetical protein
MLEAGMRVFAGGGVLDSGTTDYHAEAQRRKEFTAAAVSV